MHTGFGDLLHAQFTGDGCQRQDIEILIGGLVRVIRLVAFADAIPDAVVLKNVAIKKVDGIPIVGQKKEEP